MLDMLKLLGLVGPSGSNNQNLPACCTQRGTTGCSSCLWWSQSHQDFLLDPYQRRAFNEVHGFLTPTVNVAWWSDAQWIVWVLRQFDALCLIEHRNHRIGSPTAFLNLNLLDGVLILDAGWYWAVGKSTSCRIFNHFIFGKMEPMTAHV